MSATIQYKYKELGEFEIRILSLPLEIAENEPLICRINHVDQRTKPDYSAISYTWGCLDLVETISLCAACAQETESYILNITANCKAAIQALCRNAVTNVWIDAICIDQNNNDERNKQVRRMRDIYAQANQTIIFLGEMDETRVHSFFAAQRLMARCTDLIAAGREIDTSSELFTQIASLMYNKAQVESDMAFIEDLVGKTWFGRIWVLQEIAVAEKVLVLFSNAGFWDWEELVKHLKSSDTNRKVYGPDITPALPRIFDLQHAVREQKFSLLELLIETAQSKATNPRDHIYGLLSISHDTDELSIPINYDAPPSRLFTDAAKRMVETSGRLNVLCLTQKTVGNDRTQGLSSWVPDFTTTPKRTVLGYPRGAGGSDRIYDRGNSGYLASHNHSFTGRFEDHNDNGCTLHVRGIMIGKIVSLSEAYSGQPHPRIWEDFAAKLFTRSPFAWLSGNLTSASINNLLLLSQENFVDSFARTIIADTILNGSQAQQGPIEKNAEWGEKMYHPEGALLDWRHRVESDTDIPERSMFAEQIHRVCTGRKLAVTDKWSLALVPDNSAVGDYISVLLGGDVPFVLRSKDQDVVLIGECYCHGVMKGECIVRQEEFGYTVQDIAII